MHSEFCLFTASRSLSPPIPLNTVFFPTSFPYAHISGWGCVHAEELCPLHWVWRGLSAWAWLWSCFLEHGQLTSDHTTEENDTSAPQQPSAAHNFWGRVGPHELPQTTSVFKGTKTLHFFLSFSSSVFWPWISSSSLQLALMWTSTLLWWFSGDCFQIANHGSRIVAALSIDVEHVLVS